MASGEKPSRAGPSKAGESSQLLAQSWWPKCFDFGFELLKFSIIQLLCLTFVSQGSLQQHATLGDRVDYLEKLMGDSADKHANEIGQAVDLCICASQL